MQNKGFVKVFAVLLTLVCIFYLSFSFVTRHYESKAAEIAATEGEEAGRHYLDSLANERVYLGVWTLKECRNMGIGLGLDLKGGMNVVLEVSVPDVVLALSENDPNPQFQEIVTNAKAEAKAKDADFLDIFFKDFKATMGDGKLATIFAKSQLQGEVNPSTSDENVEKAIRSHVDDAIANSFNVLRTRIDRFGVVQPNIQEIRGQKGRIMVELPGVKEPDRVRDLLQGSANLEFWLTHKSADISPFMAAIDQKLASTGIAEELTDEDGHFVAKSFSDDNKRNPLLSRLIQLRKDDYCVVGYAHKQDREAVSALLATDEAKDILPDDVRLFWGVKAVDKQDDLYELYAIKVTTRNGRAVLEGDVVEDAKDEFDEMGGPCVSMTMKPDGAGKWAKITRENVGHPVAVVLDNLVYSAPNIRGEIPNGRTQITGSFTVEDTRDLANVLKSGKMPAPAKIVSDEIVGPSLGQESINQGMWSMVLAFIALMIYMICMYGFIPGMVANCALILNLFFTIGILTSFQAALTMSGIAGMVLTLGMAVDANVLIYERIKEEMAGGKAIRAALKDGYGNAFSAIIDSNVTSVLTGIILYNFGTGPIKGFATTYIIGIIISFFTAVFLTRVLYDDMMKRDKWLGLTFSTPISRNFMSNTKFNFMGSYKRSFAIFGIIAVLSIVSWSVRGFSRSIDFTGGRTYTVVFDKDVNEEDVRGLLAEAFPESNTAVIKTIDPTTGEAIRITTNYKIDDDTKEIDSEVEETLFNALKKGNLLSETLELKDFKNREVREGGSIIRSQKVGPSIAANITKGAIISVVLALIVIFVYILVRFRNVAFSVGAIFALAIDTIFILGMFSACWGWMPFSLEIDQTFIGALLTCIGYSINDKVVVFDRIRENIGLYPKRDRQQLFNQSLNATLTRTINTSVSTFIVLLFIFVFGGASIRSFAFAMMLGVIIGTLTSMFIAAPTAYLVMGRRIKEEE